MQFSYNAVQVVILSQVLAHPANNGYQGFHDLEVRAVNGAKVKNLRQMKELVENAQVDGWTEVVADVVWILNYTCYYLMLID